MPARMIYRGSLPEYHGLIGTVLDDQEHPGRYLFLPDGYPDRPEGAVLRNVRKQSLDFPATVLD